MSEKAEIENLLTESRRFSPSVEFSQNAIAQPAIYHQATDFEAFWADQARKLHWHKPFIKTLDFSDAPFARWFEDGELNVSYNCLDRHVEVGWGKRIALFFEGVWPPAELTQISLFRLSTKGSFCSPLGGISQILSLLEGSK